MKRDSVSAYVRMRRDTLLSLCASAHILDVLLPIFQLRTYLMDGLFLNQKQIRLFQYQKEDHGDARYIMANLSIYSNIEFIEV